MTSEEIVRYFRQAKDQDADIQVLADLNMTTREAIWAVLEEAGEALTTKRKAAKPRQNFGDSIAPLYAQGLTDAVIAYKVGCTKQNVAAWRKRRGLQQNQEDVKMEKTQAAQPTKSREELDEEDWSGVCRRAKQIMDAVPRDIDAEVRRQAGRLCLAILAESITARLCVRMGAEDGGA